MAYTLNNRKRLYLRKVISSLCLLLLLLNVAIPAYSLAPKTHAQLGTKSGIVTQSGNFSIAISMGGSKISGALLDESGNLGSEFDVTYKDRFGKEGVELNPEDIVGLLRKQIGDILNDVPAEGLQRVGIVSPGPVNAEEGIVGYPYKTENLPFEHYPLKARLEEAIQEAFNVGIVAQILHDAPAALYGELSIRGGLYKHQEGMIWIQGTGINAKAAQNGKPYNGERGEIMEVGWNLVGSLREDGKWHYRFTGNETLGNIPTLKEGEKVLEQRLSGPNLDARFTKEGYPNWGITGAALKGDQKAIGLIKDVGEEFGRGMAALLVHYSKEGFAKHHVLVSGVAEKLGLGVVDSEGKDLYISAVQRGVLEELIALGVEAKVAKELSEGVERSTMTYEREYLAFAPKAGPQVKITEAIEGRSEELLIEQAHEASLANLRKEGQKVVDWLTQRDSLPDKADLIMVLGSNDIAVPIEAAGLYHRGLAPKIIVSGGIGRLTYGLLEQFRQFLSDREISQEEWLKEEDFEQDEEGNRLIPEAKIFQKILRVLGVPEENILVESKSKNTGANVQESRKVLEQRNLLPKSVILMQTPLLQRRAGAIFQYQFGVPGVTLINYAPYVPNLNELDEEELVRVSEMALGEIQRLLKYDKPESEGGPVNGPFITPISIPREPVLESSLKIAVALTVHNYHKRVYQWTNSLNEYPDAKGLEKARRSFIQLENGAWIPKAFEGEGHLEVGHIFQEHQRLLNARAVFEPMVREIAQVFEGREDEVRVHWIQPGEEHITVAVIQDDKEILDEELQQRYVRVNEEEVQAASEVIERIVGFRNAPSLGRVGYAPTADGGMIMLFYDKSGDFLSLRQDITARTNEAIHGKGVSRPRLINMTVGRILELPYSSDPEIAQAERKKVVEIVKRYARKFRRAWWGFGPGGDEISLDNVVYGWDRRGNFAQFEPLRTFSFRSTAPSDIKEPQTTNQAL